MKTPNMERLKEESMVLLSQSKPMDNNNTLENGEFHPFDSEKKLQIENDEFNPLDSEKKTDVVEIENGGFQPFDIEKKLEEGADIKSKSRVPLLVAWVCVGCAITFVTIAVIVIVTQVTGVPKPSVPSNQSTTVSPSSVSTISTSSIQPTTSSSFTPSSIVTSSPVSQTTSQTITLQSSMSLTASTSTSVSPTLSTVLSSSVSVSTVISLETSVMSTTFSPTKTSVISTSLSMNHVTTATVTIEVTTPYPVISLETSVMATTFLPTKTSVISTSLSTNHVTTATVTIEVTTPYPACNDTEFQCIDGSCIDRLYVCDGLPTCPNGEDEDKNCVCSEDQFSCSSGQCIPKNLRCDGVAQCYDLSDEVNCSNCRGFQCDSGLCLPASFRCNDRVDCLDLSDEISCPWRRGYWQCDNGLSVPNNRWCDGVDDCYDNTDEEDCEGECHFLGERVCPDMMTCILHEWWCDGHFDCPDGADEVNCVQNRCSSSEFQCFDRTCISKEALCDGIIDCPSRDDESDCLELKNSGNSEVTSGLVLVKSENQQVPVCNVDWSHDLSHRVCQYLGFESSSGYRSVEGSGSQSYMTADKPEQLHHLSTNQTLLAVMKEVSSCSSNSLVSVSCKPKVCGERKVNLLSSFIVGGTISPLGKWPWVVSISFLGKDICGGVLVDDRWVLTAAHCIVSKSFNYTMLPFNFEVTAGTVYRKRSANNENDIHRQMFKVDRIVVNPNTVAMLTGVMDWDMALLRLSKPVVYDSYTQPVCLPSQGETVPIYSLCYLAGWGYINSQQQTVNELRDGKMRLWGDEDCRRNTVSGESHVNTNSTLCAGYNSGLISACQGDSGGPLMCTDSSGHWTVVGVMSSGSEGCDGQQSQANRYAKVSTSREWIDSVIHPS